MRLMIRLAVSLALLVPLAACGKKIGDECKTAFDCNQTDEARTCDISQPGGYCILEGCDEGSCPSEAICVRFFPRVNLDQSCDPQSADACGIDGICVAGGDGSTFQCVPRATEFRRCMLGCADGGDCRDGYECRLAGTYGSVALIKSPGARVKFCAPRGP